MRRFLFAVALTCGLATFAAAQSLQVESFDRSGLPTRAQTQTERDLLRRISTHRRGNTADAVDIQRNLATYYRSKGDYQRARVAEERANTAAGYAGDPTGMRPYGMTPGMVVAPKPSSRPPAPTYGAPVPSTDKPAGDGISIPVYQPEAGQAAPAAEVVRKANPDVTAAPKTPPEATTPEFSGRFFALQGRTMHTWEFRPDGTFEHAWAPANAASTDAAHVEAGTFRVAGPYLMLMMMRGTTGGPAPARELRMEMRGAGGKDGLLLNGIMLRPKMP